MELLLKSLACLDLKKLATRRVWIIGRLEHVTYITDWLACRGISIEGVLDNDSAKQGRWLGQVVITAPKEALLPYDDQKLIIIYAPKYWRDLLRQFAGYGYQEGRQVLVLDRPCVKRNRELARLGARTYRSLVRRYGKTSWVFLVNCPVGDFYLLALYFRAYLRQNGIENYVLAGTSLGIEKLAPVFGLENAVPLSQTESEGLLQVWKLLGSDRIRLKPLTIWQGSFDFNPSLARQHAGLTFMDTFRSMIFRLPEEERPAYPAFRGDARAIHTLFQRENLLPGKTVVLSPFAYSVQMLTPSFWRGLAQRLREAGYTVAVNLGEERETNFIPSAAGLRLSFADMILGMEYAGTVVGLRSGFFDVTSQARCRRIILYPPKSSAAVTWNRTDMEFCGLNVMGLCEDAVELEIEDEDKLGKDIMESFKEDYNHDTGSSKDV